ncbi:hypothetical protein IF2G_01302 [Cordyceps javanica]|nr:hypothetical protein IF2G_01302 [Cordyceps javanica]
MSSYNLLLGADLPPPSGAIHSSVAKTCIHFFRTSHANSTACKRAEAFRPASLPRCVFLEAENQYNGHVLIVSLPAKSLPQTRNGPGTLHDKRPYQAQASLSTAFDLPPATTLHPLWC